MLEQVESHSARAVSKREQQDGSNLLENVTDYCFYHLLKEKMNIQFWVAAIL